MGRYSLWVVEVTGGEDCAALNCSETGTWKEEMLCKKWSLISKDCTKLHCQNLP